MKVRNHPFLLIIVLLISYSCSNKTTTNSQPVAETYQKVSPDFNADSAYNYIDKQVAFGPRVPNTSQHVSCGNYLVNQLKSFGAAVYEQNAVLTAFDGTKLNARNIVGSFNPDKKDRILLFAHWDTRPFSDRDPDPQNYNKPILGANDAASGVGVLLEVARNLQIKSPEVGVDIIFFDAEDYGTPSFLEKDIEGDWWCLGSQYWAKNPHISDYKAKYGILLDMVAAPDAKFYKEQFSKKYAGGVVEKMWNIGRQLGYGTNFVSKDGGYIMDDHIPVNQYRHIPSIDIIQYDENTDTGFGGYWHTQKDDMSNINKETLKTVGQTLLEVVYLEK